MAGDVHGGPERDRGHWWLVAWGAGALLLSLPLIAMQFTDEVNWTLADFAVFAGMLVSVGGAYSLVVRHAGNALYRLALAGALLAAFLLVWLGLGVGIIGRDGDPANLAYGAVLAVGIGGALATRFRPRGMTWTMIAAALTQLTIGAVAIVTGLGEPLSGPLELAILNGFFVSAFAGSAWLFHRAAQAQSAR